MSNYSVTDVQLTSIANAIRAKGGASGQIVFPSGFVSGIQNISGGGGGFVAPSGMELKVITMLTSEDQVTVSHNFGHVPKYAALIASCGNGEWAEQSEKTILVSLLGSSITNGTFDINNTSQQKIDTVYILGATNYTQSNSYTTYPAAMTADNVTFATGRYYSGKFMAGVTYLAIIVG